MGKMQREKGARFERTLASLLKAEGFEAERTAQHSGKNGGEPDVRGLPGIHIEAKAQEKMHLYDWMDQAKRDAEDTGNYPTIFHKQNHKEILVTMRFEDWMQLYKEFYAGVEDNG